MDIEKSNTIISISVVLIQTLVLIALAVPCAQFFLNQKSANKAFLMYRSGILKPANLRLKNELIRHRLFLCRSLSLNLKNLSSKNHKLSFLGTTSNILPPMPTPLKGKPIKFEKKKVDGIPLYLATISLKDPETFITLALPHDAKRPIVPGKHTVLRPLTPLLKD